MALPYSCRVRTLASIGPCAWLPSRAATAADDDQPVATKPATDTRHAARRLRRTPSAAPARCGCCGSAASTSPPTSPRRAATRAASSSSARARSASSRARRVLGDAVPRHRGPRHHRRRERPAVDGVRARLPDLAPLLGLLHGPAGLHPDRPVPRAPRPIPNRADPSSRRSVIRVPHHRFNHKGGQLQVGPDGMLYAGFGDGGAGGDPDENAQNLGRMLGKMIRIDPRPGGGYSIPPDNPFRNRSGALPRDLRVRGAQPVPVLVRPPHAAPHHRRRGPGRDRGDRLHPGALGRPPAARRLQLRLGHASRAATGTSPAPRPGTSRP